MSSNAKDETVDDDRPRYAELTAGNGECIIYDRENQAAWIQSTVSLPVARID